MLAWLLDPDHPKNGFHPPTDVKPIQIGVFSVEGEVEIGHQLRRLGISVFIEKRPGLRDTILLELIDTILAQHH